ncbi:hypothetical protein BGZ94_001586, partial [Podila epigama]
VYRINIALTTPIIVIVYLMATYKVAELDIAGLCYVGLQRASALPLIIYDILLSAWLTFLFIRPLVNPNSSLQGPSKGKLRQVARRTLIGSIVALVLSASNIFTVAYFEGRELGLVCLTCCTADVTLNAISIHWVTARGSTSQSQEKGQHGTGHAGASWRSTSDARRNRSSVDDDAGTSFEKEGGGMVLEPLETQMSMSADGSEEGDHRSSSRLYKH